MWNQFKQNWQLEKVHSEQAGNVAFLQDFRERKTPAHEIHPSSWFLHPSHKRLTAVNSDTSLKQSDAHKSLETHLIEKLRSRRLSVEEAANFLDSLGADKSETETILSHLKELQYLDDIQLAEALMHTYYECKKLSTTAVQAQMRKRKIASSVIDTVTDQFTNKNPEGEDNETERVIALAQKRAQQLAFLDKTVIQRRLIGFLLRKGYSFDVVHKALNHIDLSDT